MLLEVKLAVLFFGERKDKEDIRACLVEPQLSAIGKFYPALRSAISHLATAKLLP